ASFSSTDTPGRAPGCGALHQRPAVSWLPEGSRSDQVRPRSRCLGLSRSETLLLYALQLLLLGLLASAIGALLGWLAQLGLFR
ncbi:hypothetical protein FLI59_34450, partial [Pseudomonas aeruginosa]